MRQIKFRGKRVDNGEWVYGSLNTWQDGTCEISHSELNDEMIKSIVDPATIGQFTGLLDDNEIEIYEDDIVVDISGIKLSVEWNDDTCKFQFSDGSDINDGNRYGTYKVVVSNLHDSPSLTNH